MKSDSVWFGQPDLHALDQTSKDTLAHTLGIVCTEIGGDYLRGTMPVDARTRQPFGVLHGGASVSLAESLGSLAANLTLDVSAQYGVGIEVNANHVRSVSEGLVTGTARPLHIGRNTQVWEIRICDEQDRLTCISRLTVAILDHRKPG
ncbi:MAG: hotdog fold thioesterase [Gammaproteobacteria bacterium]|nr:hotdog fold thioesterase [Gammaproteobacteria bacterium]